MIQDSRIRTWLRGYKARPCEHMPLEVRAGMRYFGQEKRPVWNMIPQKEVFQDWSDKVILFACKGY